MGAESVMVRRLRQLAERACANALGAPAVDARPSAREQDSEAEATTERTAAGTAQTADYAAESTGRAAAGRRAAVALRALPDAGQDVVVRAGHAAHRVVEREVEAHLLIGAGAER